jgi:beta-glucosidase
VNTEGSDFPIGFLWGTASAGYQFEGNSRNTDFWEWEKRPGAVALGQKSQRACDWWEGRRWQEDFDNAATDGHRAHRLSVEWSRVEPEPGQWDQSALDHYRQIVQGLRDRGIEPLVTLHHFVNPLWATDQGVWETGEIVPLFERYTQKVVSALGDRVHWWCTINEPNGYMLAGWAAGAFPPGKKDLRLVFKVARNILRAHAAAYHTIHRHQPSALVGLPIHFRPILPHNQDSALDRCLARLFFDLFSSFFPDAIRTGRMRQLAGPSLAVPEVRQTLDYFALNYYTTDVVQFDLRHWRELFGRRSFPPSATLDDAGFYASYPPGFLWSLRWANAYGLPVFVTENGIGDAGDRLRPGYIVTHLVELLRALHEGCDIRGYLHWSLVDNFEWTRGWTHRFGLYGLDIDTLVRTPRASAKLYAAICRSNALSAEALATFAPHFH